MVIYCKWYDCQPAHLGFGLTPRSTHHSPHYHQHCWDYTGNKNTWMFYKCFFQPNWCKTKTCSTQKWAIPHCVPISKCSYLCGIHQNGRPITAWALSSSSPKSFPMLNSSACLSVHCHVALKLRQDADFMPRRCSTYIGPNVGTQAPQTNIYTYIRLVAPWYTLTNTPLCYACSSTRTSRVDRVWAHESTNSRSRIAPWDLHPRSFFFELLELASGQQTVFQ